MLLQFPARHMASLFTIMFWRAMSGTLANVIGGRGEKKLELCLTDYQNFKQPLFRLGFLGDKWPTVDFYVELTGLKKQTPYFLAQVKTNARNLSADARYLTISTKKRDIERLLRIPGPTYIFGVHEPSGRVFFRSIHSNSPARAVSRIPIDNEVHSGNLLSLRNEVRDFWKSSEFKPSASLFS
jgi:hypothetical protein